MNTHQVRTTDTRNNKLINCIKDHPTLVFSISLLAMLLLMYLLWPDFADEINRVASILMSADQARIKEWVKSYGAWGPLGIILLMVVQMFLVVVPSWLLMLIAVMAYGAVPGSLLAILAVAVASSVGYGLGLMAGPPLMRRMLGQHTEQKIRRETERYGLWAVVIARLNPLLSNDAVSIVGGSLQMGYVRFLVATLAGITPLAIAIAVMGEDWKNIETGLLVLSLLSLGGLAAKIVVDKKQARAESA